SGNYVPEEYLPDELRGARFYEPSTSGEEREIAERLAKWREEIAQKRAEEASDESAVEAAAKKLE
ncbi:MAG TPA: hypothetical protein VLW85_23670, partial [Myxococcales bacterium]|nr:hypothetical protein [Myxococcales bacterium]